MKLSSIYKFPILLVSLIILLYLIQLIASERVEVVELHTLNIEGEEIITRLWVVDFLLYHRLHQVWHCPHTLSNLRLAL